MYKTRLAILLVCSTLLASCASGPSLRPVQKDLAEDRPGAALEKIEPIVAEFPESFEARMLLGHAHYRIARQALDGGDEETYASHLEKALDAYVEATRIRPDQPGPHTNMAIIAAYRSDMRGALEGLENAAELSPNSPIAYANLAEVHIYLGNMTRARAMLDKARKLGAHPVIVEINEVLAAWKDGDMVEARDIFDGAYALNPEYVQVWNEAPVAQPIETFDDFVQHCCREVTCGPYMRLPCERMQLEVAERELAAETLRREREAENRRRRRLREIYAEPEARRGGVSIEIEEPEEDAAP